MNTAIHLKEIIPKVSLSNSQLLNRNGYRQNQLSPFAPSNLLGKARICIFSTLETLRHKASSHCEIQMHTDIGLAKHPKNVQISRDLGRTWEAVGPKSRQLLFKMLNSEKKFPQGCFWIFQPFSMSDVFAHFDREEEVFWNACPPLVNSAHAGQAIEGVVHFYSGKIQRIVL